MPYLRCPHCQLRTFSAARWSTVDHCGRCGAELPRPRHRSREREGPRFVRVSRARQLERVAAMARSLDDIPR